jgi:hypothetical protein
MRSIVSLWVYVVFGIGISQICSLIISFERGLEWISLPLNDSA